MGAWVKRPWIVVLIVVLTAGQRDEWAALGIRGARTCTLAQLHVGEPLRKSAE